jgi:hypothetical protein
LARNDVEPSGAQQHEARSHTGTPENFFIIFVDRIFTTFIECPFTNVFDANREITGNP